MLTIPVPIESVLLLIWIVPVLMLSVVLLVGVGCVCAYNLLGFQGRMIRRVGWVAEWVLGQQNPVGGSSGGTAWREVSHLSTGCSGLYQSSGVPPELGAGPRCFTVGEMGVGEHRICPGV